MKFNSWQIFVVAVVLGISTEIFAQVPARPGAGIQVERSTQQREGTRVNITETYRAENNKLLKDFFADNPKPAVNGKGPVEIGRNNEFKVVVPTEGNRDTTVNLNLYVTVEKGYVRLTREQKRSLSMISVQERFVNRFSSEGQALVRLEQEGIQIGENVFIRVTRDPKFRFLDDDDYYFVASRTSIQEGGKVERVDPVDLLVEPGTDRELAHYGISHPEPHDYLARHSVEGDAYYPAYYPRTANEIQALNEETDQKNEWVWKRFHDELQRKRDELGLGLDSKALRPELYFRYHYSTYAPEKTRPLVHKIGTDEFLRYEWHIAIPSYTTYQQVVNVPPDYQVAFTDFIRRNARENERATNQNNKLWSEFINDVRGRARIPDPFYSQYYWRHVYDVNKHFINITPDETVQNDPPERGSLAELRKHGIKLPSYYKQVLLMGIPLGPNVGVIMDPADAEAINEYNRRVTKYNQAQWARFKNAIRDNGLRMSDYKNKVIAGTLVIDIWDIDLVSSGLWFYFINRQSLPKIPDPVDY